MEKSQEHIVRQDNNYQIVRYTYYFKTDEECVNYQLKDTEHLLNIYYLMDETSEFKLGMNVEEVRVIQSKYIYDADEYKPFIKNLQKTQYNFGYDSEWYNKWIYYIGKLPYNEALSLIELLNEFYITGKENVW